MCIFANKKSVMLSISIIIPVYKVKQYIQRCLESVIYQDFNDVDIECIIVNDCTPDDSMVIVHHIISNYHGLIRFEIVEHKINRGVSAARNTGLSQATGDYVFFIDSDDYLQQDCFRLIIEYLKKFPESDMIVGNVKQCNGDDILLQKMDKPLYIDDRSILFQRMLRHQIYLYPWNKLIRRNLLVDNCICFEEGIIYEDVVWSYELFSCLSSILLLPQITYIYENNPLSIVNTTFTNEKADFVLRSYARGVSIIMDNPPDPNRYHYNLTVDYLLFMMNFLMMGVDLISRHPISDASAKAFRNIRVSLLTRSTKYGRLIMSSFCLLLFPPFSYIQKFRVFRRHYYKIDAILNRFCHFFDFLHNKKRI